MDDPGFEGIGDFSSVDPWQRYIAHQAAKGDYPTRGEAARRRAEEASRNTQMRHLRMYTSDRPKTGRPRIDKLDHVDAVADLLAAEPYLSANEVAFRLQIRRQDAGRIVAAFRRAQGASQTRGEGKEPE